MLFKKIVFPTDFSNLSERARGYAAPLAKLCGSTVYVLHAIEPIELTNGEADEEIAKFYDDIRREAERKMEGEKEHFQKLGIEAETVVLLGKRWSTINSFASENHADLIVLGSHGIRTREGNISIGTTSHKVAMTSPCPVLIVPHEED